MTIRDVTASEWTTEPTSLHDPGHASEAWPEDSAVTTLVSERVASPEEAPDQPPADSPSDVRAEPPSELRRTGRARKASVHLKDFVS